MICAKSIWRSKALATDLTDEPGRRGLPPARPHLTSISQCYEVIVNNSLDSRVAFQTDERIMQIDLTDLVLQDSTSVGALYDMLERRAAATGAKWFFLINYLNCRIYPEAWVTFANRGKKFNMAFSLGTVRYNTEDETNTEILRRASEEKFDANLVANREAALAKLAKMRANYFKRHPVPKPIEKSLLAEFDRRISFDHDANIMEVDFSNFRFTDSRIVNAFYDTIGRRISESGRHKWFYLVNYRNCEVHPQAWLAHAHRGERMNSAHSLGSARYSASDSAALSIRKWAGSEKFDPNLLPTREEALHMIEEMRRSQSDRPVLE